MKLTRRQLVVAAAGAGAAVKALAQPAGGSAANPDFAKQAHDSVQRNADTLAKFQLTISVEPAFQFKA